MNRDGPGSARRRGPRLRKATPTPATRGAHAGAPRRPPAPSEKEGPEPEQQRRFAALIAAAEASHETHRAVAPGEWPKMQLRLAAALGGASVLEAVAGLGWLASVAGLVALPAIFLPLRERWRPPAELDLGAKLAAAAVVLAACLPPVAALLGQIACAVVVALAGGLAAYVTFDTSNERTRDGFTAHLAEEAGAFVALVASATLAAREWLWPWALWIGALPYLHGAALALLDPERRSGRAPLARIVPALAGLATALLFLPLPRVPLAAVICVALAAYYGRSALRSAGAEPTITTHEPAGAQPAGLDEDRRD